MSTLRDKIIRLAHANPGPVRDALLPILASTEKTSANHPPGQEPDPKEHLAVMKAIFKGIRPLMKKRGKKAVLEIGWAPYIEIMGETGVELTLTTHLDHIKAVFHHIEQVGGHGGWEHDTHIKWDLYRYGDPRRDQRLKLFVEDAIRYVDHH